MWSATRKGQTNKQTKQENKQKISIQTTDIQTKKQACKQRNKPTKKHINKQTNNLIDNQTNRQNIINCQPVSLLLYSNSPPLSCDLVNTRYDVLCLVEGYISIVVLLLLQMEDDFTR